MIGKLLQHYEFEDRFAKNPTNAVDVIIPIIHTNEMWEANLKSIYREIPVKRLLISDGGCIDDSLIILKNFPRVEIFDHKKFVSLGYCLRKLMEEVKTEYFVYLHSDVFLSQAWFETMWQDKTKYDWWESKQTNAYLLDFEADYSNYDRALSGGQIGRKAAFDKVLPLIDDDYLYRNEDIIFSELIKKFGGKYGRNEALLYHEIMNKRSQWRRSITNFSFNVDKSREEEVREFDMQARGLIKYLPPNSKSKIGALASINRLIELNKLDLEQFKEWVKTTPYGDEWLEVINNNIGTSYKPVDVEFREFAKSVLDVLRKTKRLLKAIFRL